MGESIVFNWTYHLEFLLLWSYLSQYSCRIFIFKIQNLQIILKLLLYNVTNEGLNGRSLVRNVEEPHLCFSLDGFSAEEYIIISQYDDSKRANLAFTTEIITTAANDYLAQLATLQMSLSLDLYASNPNPDVQIQID